MTTNEILIVNNTNANLETSGAYAEILAAVIADRPLSEDYADLFKIRVCVGNSLHPVRVIVEWA